MKKTLSITLLAAAALVATNANADQDLATKSGCMACHNIDMKLVGPSYKDVAAKYKDQEGARDMLVASVIKGGVNMWGPVPMPPKGGRADVSDEDIGKIVDWILAQ